MSGKEGKASRHPKWHGPFGESDLKVLNSLTSMNVPFVPQKGRSVKWYTCGPTVYDSAHLGHARAYVTFDIIRRLLEDYFGYDVTMVMNITDIDDKIILRARQNHLLAQYVAESKDASAVHAYAQKCFASAVEVAQGKVKKAEVDYEAAVNAVQTAKEAHVKDLGKVQAAASDAKNDLMELGLKLKNLEEERDAYEKVAQAVLKEKPGNAVQKLATAGKSALMPALDKAHGSEVTDHSIFNAHSRYYEQEFLEDMRNLGVRDADVLTRVSEFVPEVIAFIERIIKNGFAYPAKSGSVYFDVAKYAKQSEHDYGKLAPWAVGNLRLLEDGEGALQDSAHTAEKKNDFDFALWKASRPGEPSWESPWGSGRPGWHIECSTMATDVLGDTMDIHTGGEDLKFPHHDNELAQSEAFSGRNQWVNHFWHAGHLHIGGLKMSKSLKNFTTIRTTLQHYTARQLRYCFLAQPWHGKMNYSDASLLAAMKTEKLFRELFINSNTKIRLYQDACAQQKSHPRQAWDAYDRGLHNALMATEAAVRAALSDNFQYPAALHALVGLAGVVNVYFRFKLDVEKALSEGKTPSVHSQWSELMADVLSSKDNEGKNNARDADLVTPLVANDSLQAHIQPMLLRRVLRYIRKMLKCFGVLDTADKIEYVAGADSDAQGQGAAYLDVLSKFRTQFRQLAMREMANAKKKVDPESKEAGSQCAVEKMKELCAAMLTLCDELRDEHLPPLGVRLEDNVGTDGATVWKLDDPETLMKEIAEKKQREAEAQRKKAVKRIKALQRTVNDFAQVHDLGEAGVGVYFSRQTVTVDGVSVPVYTQCDEEGLPVTHYEKGELTKSSLKKLKKERQRVEKAWKKYQKEAAKDPDFYAKAVKEVEESLET